MAEFIIEVLVLFIGISIGWFIVGPSIWWLINKLFTLKFIKGHSNEHQ